MTCGVYRIIHIASGRFYLGSSRNVEHRWKCHIRDLEAGNHHNRFLQRAYNKYGRSAFLFEIAQECAESERLAWEQVYLDNAWGSEKLYNIVPFAGQTPSMQGKKRSPESVEKFKSTMEAKSAEEKAAMVDRMRATKLAMSPEKKAEIYRRVSETFRATLAGKPAGERSVSGLATWAARSDEERKAIATKISASKKGRKASPKAIAANRAKGLGKKATLETRQKMSESRTGMKMSQECLDKRKTTWATKSPEELAEIRAKMWATRKANKAARK